MKKTNFLIHALCLTMIGCACEFVGLENVQNSQTPYEKKTAEEVKKNAFTVNGQSDTSTAGNLQTVYYAYKSKSIKGDQLVILERNAQELKRYTNIKVIVSAHTDNVGGVIYNTKLGAERANRIVDYFISRGIAPDRLSIKVFGPTDPLVNDSSKEVKTYQQIQTYKSLFNKNRRINFIINSI